MKLEKTNQQKPCVFDYLDYRIFLNDLFIWKKKEPGEFSYRILGKESGIAASLFKDIVSGRQSLTEKSAEKYASYFKLKKREKEYLICLLNFANAKSNTEKNSYFEDLMQLRRVRSNLVLESSKYEYFSSWYHAVIRELIHNKPLQFDLETLGSKINPKISEAKVKKSLELLEQLGFIQKKTVGDQIYWQKTDNSVSSGFEVRSQALVKYHQQMIALGMESIDRFTPEQRNLQAMTLSGSQEAFDKIKVRMNQFVNEVFNILEEDDVNEKVMALTMQLFPLAENNFKEGERNA